MADPEGLRRFPGVDDRVETGPIQFGDDWPGAFIRGDNAFHFGITLQRLLKEWPVDPMDQAIVDGLAKTLMSSRVK